MFPAREPVRRDAWSLALLLAGVSALSGCQYSSGGLNAEGVALYQRGNYDGAMDKFQQALYQNPESADAYYNLASAHHRIGKMGGDEETLYKAEKYYNQCLDRDGNHADCYRALAVLLTEQGRSDEAFRLLEGWTSRSPGLAQPRIELARLHEEIGQQLPARECLLEAIAIEPHSARAHAALGRIYEQTGNYEQAMSSYQISLASDRFQPAIENRLALLQTSLPMKTVVHPATDKRIVATHAPTLR